MAICPFNGCNDPVLDNGACEGHQKAAALVIRGMPPACIHGVPLIDDCLKCGGEAARRRLADANTVNAATQGRYSEAMRDVDAKLCELARLLAERDIQVKLGPHGGRPVATHLGLPGADGRVYAIRYEANADNVGYTVHWGDLWVITAQEPGAIVTYFVGLRMRSGKRK